MIDLDEIAVEGRTVLELGAGAGLPGLMCALVSIPSERRRCSELHTVATIRRHAKLSPNATVVRRGLYLVGRRA